MYELTGTVTKSTAAAVQLQCKEFAQPEWFPRSALTGLLGDNFGQVVRVQVADWIAVAKGLITKAESTQEADKPEVEGVYVVDGVIVKVKKSQTSGHLYACKLVEIGGDRLTNAGSVVNFEYQYAAGLIYQVKKSNKMTKDQAVHFGIRYGSCMRCGRKLKDAKSVEAAIGPICMKYYN